MIVGEGAYRERYMREVVELGLGSNVTWTGLVEDPVAEGAYAAADVFCQVSRWEEAFGFAIAEGIASGRPILATSVGGIPKLVEDGKTGFLVERGDSEAMAERILQLLANPELRERMGRAGRQAAEAKFDHRQKVAEVVRLYGIG